MSDTQNAAAIASQLIRHYESCARRLADGRIAPYADPRDIPTIGWGNTRWQDDRAVTLDDAPISQDDADALFLFWLNRFSGEVAALAPGAQPNELAAFTSLAYNIGTQNFSSSSALRQFRAGNKQAAGEGIDMWNRSGGQVLKGLERRRRAERYVFGGQAVADAIAQAEQDFP